MAVASKAQVDLNLDPILAFLLPYGMKNGLHLVIGCLVKKY